MNEKAKILLIDDEQVILDAVSKIASLERWEVDTVLNAQDGLNKLNRSKYELILSDIMMPDLDGFQLLEALYSKQNNIPVIMITGFSTVENAVKSLYNGAIDFIPKPFTYEEITSSICRGLEYNKIQKRVAEAENSGKDESIIFVPCPAKYKRLGYMSWMNLEYEGSARIGATDLFLETIENTTSIELMEIEDLIIQGSTCAKFDTTDNLIHNCLAPLGGRIVERNEKIMADSSLLEKDPFFEGWLYRIIPSDIEFDMKYLIPCSSDRI
jgi:YesN/AraC family two-component response regulator